MNADTTNSNDVAPRRWRASAPVRLDLAGGWTDVAPFATEVGGLVVNAAIDLRAHAEVTTGVEHFELHCADSGLTVTGDNDAWHPVACTGLDFHKAAIRRSPLGPCRIVTRSDVPRGSGLGGSGALGVALAAALNAAAGGTMSPARLAEEAFQLEAVDAAIPGGRQDQYAAALGGVQSLRFTSEGVSATPLTLDPAFANALLEHTVICYTGVSRTSGHTIARVMGAYRDGVPGVVGALHGMIDVAHRMTEALLAGDLARTGDLLSRNWIHQQALDPQMQTPGMAALEEAMRDAGVLGAKAAGSGAGGSIFFLVRDRTAALDAAARCGAVPLPFRWSHDGVRVEAS